VEAAQVFKQRKKNYILENRDNLTEDSLQELSVKIRTKKRLKTLN
jgi:amidophosphoribosyltransferase